MDRFFGKTQDSFEDSLVESKDGYDPSGIMIAFYPDDEFMEIAEPLASPESVENRLHMTMLYIKSLPSYAPHEILTRLQVLGQSLPPFDLDVTGSGAFFTPDALVRVLLMSSPDLPRVRYMIEHELDKMDYLGQMDYGHTPHITLEYHKDFRLPEGWEMQATYNFPKMKVSKLHVVRWDEVIGSFDLLGAPSTLSDLKG